MNPDDRGIPVIDANISYKQFLDDFLRPLKPCLITGLTKNWLAATKWTTTDSATGELIPDYAALKETFGDYPACITFCDEKDINGETVQQEMRVSQFITDIVSASNSHKRYLKDFHFMRVNTSLTPPYSVPKFFRGIYSIKNF